MKLPRILLALTTATALAAGIYVALPANSNPPELAAMLPPGALLTIESPDFASLLRSWNASPEQAAWLQSANYSAFSNSRLFSRLSDAQGEFEGVAGGSGLDSAFLKQVAGKESIFAWYDISKLEFLYVTHLRPGAASSIDLLKQRASFSRRESAGTPFFVRTRQPGGQDGPSTTRTIAFATSGDWLILGTREDLVANTLQLMQKSQASASLAAEAWYTAAASAASGKHGDLHMVLDLQRIVTTPAFRTYWVQRNVTATAHYRAAVADLYREGRTFREERALLPITPSDTPQPDLARLESLVPDHIGVYRASAQPSPQDALLSLQEKVLLRSHASYVTTASAPAADLSTPHPGSSTDLETRIDAPPLTAEPLSSADAPLLAALTSVGLDSMLTLDRTTASTASQGPFLPIQSAVVLHAQRAWHAPALQSAVLSELRSRLTVGSAGLTWTKAANNSFTLDSAHPVHLFIDGDLAILSNDPTLLDDLLHNRSVSAKPQPATLIAAFHHTDVRPGFLQLTAALASASSAKSSPDDAHAPDFFHDTVGTLSSAFQALDAERLTERQDGSMIRQTVTYTWRMR